MSSSNLLCSSQEDLEFIALFSVQEDSRVIRSCGFDDTQYLNQCYRSSVKGGRQEVCACDNENNCNDSVDLKSSVVLVFAATMVFVAALF